MCSRTRGRKKDNEQRKALKRRQEARKTIEEAERIAEVIFGTNTK